MVVDRVARGLLVFWLWASSLAVQGVAGAEEGMELRQIMREMGQGMQAITQAIAREEWATVAAQAPFIASHPQPSMGERLRILGYFAAESGQFKQYDSKTYEAALKLRDSALNKRGEAVIDDFARLQKSCLACHQRYRKEFIDHFYGDG